MKNRIWELDAFRGLCLLGMVVIHFVYDFTVLYAIIPWEPPAIYTFVQEWGGVLFLLLSGICVTLGTKAVRRGLIVFAGGLLVTLGTWLLWHFGFAEKSILICYGVLHCLGSCMLLWPLFRKWPWWALAAAGICFAALGLYFDTLRVESPWLFPLGLYRRDFLTSDYFPLFPNLGFFLLGAALGKTLYRKKVTLLPKVNARRGIVWPLCWVGRQSLLIYLLHQPILGGLCVLISLFQEANYA